MATLLARPTNVGGRTVCRHDDRDLSMTMFNRIARAINGMFIISASKKTAAAKLCDSPPK